MTVKYILIEFAKKHKWKYLAGFIFLLVNSAITSIIPKILGAITDGLVIADNTAYIYRYLWILVICALTAFVFRFIWRYLIVGNSRYLEVHLRAKLFSHMQTLPINFYNNNKTGDLVAYAINDINALRRTFAFGLVAILDAVVINSISIYIMAETINPILTIMALAPAPLIIFVLIKLRGTIRDRFTLVQKSFAFISDKVQENISGIRVVKAFSQEKEEMEEFAQHSKSRIETQMDLTKVSAALAPATQLFFGLSVVFFLIYGSGLVARGLISIGDYVAFNTYIGVIMGPIVSIGRIVEIWQRGIASGKRLDNIFSQQGETDREVVNTETIKGEIEIRKLNFTYPGSIKRALKNVSISVKAGETLAILGKTGSGKSTFANLLLKLYEVEDGSIFIDGQDINCISRDVLRDNIGYVPQDNFLFSTSIKGNIEFFRRTYKDDEIKQAAKMAGVYDDIVAFPDGFDTIVGERGVTLSGGQKQRVSIARALIKFPPILILDDSLSAVDTKTEEEILGNIKEVLKNRTGVIISHRISTVKHADKIVYIDRGRVVESGDHESLMALKGRYYELYLAQTEKPDDNGTAVKGDDDVDGEI